MKYNSHLLPHSTLPAMLRWAAAVLLTLTAAAPGGMFGVPQVIRSGQSPEAWVRAADVDRDGDGDVVYSPAAGKLDVLLRQADGTWNAVPLVTSGVQRVLNAVVADLDFNGLPDVAAYVRKSTGETGILTIRQSAPGVFLTDAAVYMNAGPLPAALAPLRLADVDGDGRQDLVLAWKNGTSSSNQGRVGWMRNTGGNNLFAAPSAFFLQVFDEPCDVLPADYDRDGDTDIAVADHAAGEVRVFQGPDFLVSADMNVSPPRHLELMDHNKDGRLDLLIAHGAPGSSGGLGLQVYPGTATGFQAQNWDYFAPIPLAASTSLAVADLNLDGRLDGVLGTGSSGSIGMTGLIAGADLICDLENTPAIAQPSGALSCYDDDRDGDADLIVGTATGVVRVPNLTPHRLLTNDSTTIESVAGTSAAGAAAYVSGDFNRDGRSDVAVAHATDGNIRVFFNSGGTGLTPALTTVLVANNPNCRWLTSADFDGDGDLDLAAPAMNSSRVVWYANNGTGTAWTTNVIPYAVNAAVAISAGDLNFDGRPDLITASPTGGTIHHLLNSSSGTWTGSVLASLSGIIRLEIADVVAGGRPEILVQHGSGGTVTMFRYVLFGWESTVLHPPRAGNGGDGMAVGDLDGNGLLDVVQGFGQQVNAAMQTSAGTFGPSKYLGGAGEFFGYPSGIIRSVRLADLDLDGLPECIAVFEKALGLFTMERPERPRRPALLLGKSSTEMQGDAAILCFDDDALPDVVRHSTTGTRLSVDLTAAPVLTIDAVPAWTLSGSMNYPVQEQMAMPTHRITVTNWAWAGDQPVRLTRLNAQFRHENSMLAPFDQNFFSLFFADFALYEDAAQPNVVEIGTFDPIITGITPGVPDAAGVVPLTFGLPVEIPSGHQRNFYLKATTGNLYPGWPFRVELLNGRHDDWANYPGSVSSTVFPVSARANSTAARFVRSTVTSRQSWRYSHWNYTSNTGAAGDYADPDGDGMPNVMEYALGQNPKVPGRPRLEVQSIGNWCYFSFWSMPDRPDVRLTILGSADLKDWYERGSSPASGIFWNATRPADEIFPGNLDGDLRQQVLRTPRAAGGKEFFRITAYEIAP